MAAPNEHQLKADLLQKYIEGQCTVEEKEIVERWFEQRKGTYPINRSEQQQVLRAVRKNLLEELRTSKPIKAPYITRWISIAAMLVLCCGMIFWYRSNPTKKQINRYVATTHRQVIHLPDSTIVELDAGSSLSLATDFNLRERKVVLNGQAFFNVKTNPNKPFIVHSFGLETEVLGTSFNVKALSWQHPLQVAVASGKVKSAGYPLSAGEQLTYDLKQHKGQIALIEPAHIGAWRTGTLYFEDASIEEIVKDIRWMYKVDIQLTGAAHASCRYTFNIKNERLDDVLNLLKKLTGVQYQINKNQIIMDSSTCI
ncbi:MAG: DUF4974 domain-containing protein [Pseudosphingobacterium sp.]|nr:DUF4974 domain-containing protein [Olivibacter sp. UJ_SKK_5.1]MDX3914683.1 DUF4974 domain-containing protein [Pseudosphingobacterium sp.]